MAIRHLRRGNSVFAFLKDPFETLTGLHDCLDRWQIDELKQQIQAGADIDQRDKRGNTPLLRAARVIGYRKNVSKLITYLLRQGADPLATNKAGDNALAVMAATEYMISKHSGDMLAALKLLLTAGIDPTAKNRKGLSAIDIARNRQVCLHVYRDPLQQILTEGLAGIERGLAQMKRDKRKEDIQLWVTLALVTAGILWFVAAMVLDFIDRFS